MSSKRVSVDQKSCIGCGTCVKVCPAGVFKIVNGKSYVVKPDACIVCRACITHCPTSCITINPREYEPIRRLYEG